MSPLRGGAGPHGPTRERAREDSEPSGERPISSAPAGALPSIQPGRLHVRMAPGGLLEVRTVGFLTHARLRDGHREMEALLAAAPAPVLLLRDVLAMDGFEPGVPIAAVRWAEQFKEKIARAAWVVRSGSVASVARTFELLIPELPQKVCASRHEALAFLKGK